MARRLEETTIRDFGGGWNVADSDVNLSSQYQPISENIMRGVDGSFSPRWGYRLFKDLKTGVTTVLTPGVKNLTTVSGQPHITIAWTAHGFASGNHVTIVGSGTINGIPASEINRTHSVFVVDANNIRIFTRVNATASGAVAGDLQYTKDTDIGGGNIIHKHYFNRRLIVFTDIGEVLTVDDNGTTVRIWDAGKAQALAGAPTPWRYCNFVSTDSFKSTLIATNGYNRDKPLQIKKDFTVEFLVDKATSSNAAVPRADYVLCMQGFVLLIRTEYGDPFCEISAKNTDGTFTRDPNPGDAVEIDLSTQTSTVEPVLLGGSRLRDKVYLAFYDRGMIGELNIYSGTKHEPDFSDTISEHGTVSHRTIVPLGNDIFMCDYAGVPSVSISSQSGVYVPVRLSELIAPAIQKHLASLSENTLREKCFAVYNKSDRSYMLFVPKCDEVVTQTPDDPIIVTPELRAKNQALMYIPDHKLFSRSKITIAGATAIGTIPASAFNGTRDVLTIVDDDTILVQMGTMPAGTDNGSGGGKTLTFTPVNDETIGYVFEYNKEMKIRRWSRYRDMNFACGCISQRGKTFLSKGKKIYRLGDNEEPLYADRYGEYDFGSWTNSTVYAVGNRVLDTADGIVYKCLVAHTSPSSGTFEAARAANETYWEEYQGDPIFWELETPWSEMKHRGRNKINKYVNLDTEGNERFNVAAFVNKIRYDKATYDASPAADLEFTALDFTAADTGGYGIAVPNTYSSGRRTREEKLWAFPFKGKLIRWRFSGKTTRKVKIMALTMYYLLGSVR